MGRTEERGGRKEEREERMKEGWEEGGTKERKKEGSMGERTEGVEIRMNNKIL